MDGRDDGAATPTVAEEVHRLEFDIDWPPGTVAAYLVAGPEPVLVDAGAPGDRGERELRDGLAAAGYEPADVTHLVLTHPHTDHVGQVGAVLDAGDPTVYAPAGVRARLERDPDDLADSVRATARAAGLTGEALAESVERAVDSLRRSSRLLPPGEIDVAVAGGERFSAGGLALRAVHTPGHQAEHCCLLAGDGSLFAGDQVVRPFRAACLHVGLDRGAYDAVDAFYRGYDRLAGLPVRRVLPGHGPVFEAFEDAVADSRADLDATVEDVLATLRDVAPASPVAVARARAGDVNRLTHVLLDTVGALGHLDAEGRASYDVVDGVREYRPVEQ